ncbi:uracil phosphoribosyltransferase-domain-containing protein [Chaetomium fimeti]|uniref:Uracil phosphoribosyltransferase-domain-containing protein n=1 Tax=Chaetomium fimeti TaxID=1854472 RepID=A0AAE0LUL7_9PEZI|nr:uracil phosphoribosyltransferase-domain-containing protein [Chaetomium fimeti]
MSRTKPIVIGLYGVPGAGKSTLLRNLKSKLVDTQFSFFDGSAVIASLVPGGLDNFQRATEEEKTRWRQVAIEAIGKESAESGRTAIVAGHFMFWPEGDGIGHTVHTQSDLDTYTHIIYLNTLPETVARWRELDDSRAREPASVQHLHTWQEAEKMELRRLCRNHGILFTSVAYPTEDIDAVAAMMLDFRQHTEEHNLACAKDRLDSLLDAHQQQHAELQTALVLDADKTLAPDDTGLLFWEAIAESTSRLAFSTADAGSLSALFGSPLGYTYTAFRQAMLLYEEHTSRDEFNAICETIASSVTLHPEMLSLLKHAAKHRHIVAVVVTCGLRLVWEMVLAKVGLSEAVQVVGGGRIPDGFVMTAEVKGALVARMRDVHGLYTWAVGDSPLDLPMMHEAHQALVVVGDECSRSRSMDERLQNAIDERGLRASQVLLPRDAPPRLDTTRLPQVRLTDGELLEALVRHRGAKDRIRHATDQKATKLLMTPTRDVRVSGPGLRRVHRRVGWYLATSFLADLVGLEQYDIPHVQGHGTEGHRVRHENKTTIVALMRGGEPMAEGVNDALPCAMFVHAKQPDELRPQHIKGQRTVVLVDSVVNSGKSIVEFVQRIRSLDATIAIVAIAGVVQSQSIAPEGLLGRILETDRALSMVALRLSENRFQGRGGTDTGNRLFNTTHLD